MAECLFCKIISGEIPGAKLYETDKIYAFLDINPVNRGHALVVPKEHYETLLDIPEPVNKELLESVKKISSAIEKAVGADGFNIMMNNRKAAGQLIPHAHMHIVPRFVQDGLKHWPGKEYRQGQMEEVQKQILANIR